MFCTCHSTLWSACVVVWGSSQFCFNGWCVVWWQWQGQWPIDVTWSLKSQWQWGWCPSEDPLIWTPPLVSCHQYKCCVYLAPIGLFTNRVFYCLIWTPPLVNCHQYKCCVYLEPIGLFTNRVFYCHLRLSSLTVGLFDLKLLCELTITIIIGRF